MFQNKTQYHQSPIEELKGLKCSGISVTANRHPAARIKVKREFQSSLPYVTVNTTHLHCTSKSFNVVYGIFCLLLDRP